MKNRASMSDNGSRWRLRVLHGEEKGIEDLKVSLKCHNMATKRTARNDGCTEYEKKANNENNKRN